ncbi:MAG: NusG domain II-containing protein [Magnetococcales bacterium]|nr:NusG domain II-containing protein [Magnetococcales bacterium]
MNPLSPPPLLRLLLRAANPWDRAVIAGSALAIGALGMGLQGEPGRMVQIYRDNQPVAQLALEKNGETTVEGRLGPVRVEVAEGRARLLEYASARMIGMRTGWVSRAGQAAVCIPCGVLLRIDGPPELQAMSEGTPGVDAVTR